MDEKDLEEYHNIGKAIKKSEKYNYINGKQITDPGTGKRVYEVNNYLSLIHISEPTRPY